VYVLLVILRFKTDVHLVGFYSILLYVTFAVAVVVTMFIRVTVLIGYILRLN
jgi:hypothetical protein